MNFPKWFNKGNKIAFEILRLSSIACFDMFLFIVFIITLYWMNILAVNKLSYNNQIIFAIFETFAAAGLMIKYLTYKKRRIKNNYKGDEFLW